MPIRFFFLYLHVGTQHKREGLWDTVGLAGKWERSPIPGMGTGCRVPGAGTVAAPLCPSCTHCGIWAVTQKGADLLQNWEAAAFRTIHGDTGEALVG